MSLQSRKLNKSNLSLNESGILIDYFVCSFTKTYDAKFLLNLLCEKVKNPEITLENFCYIDYRTTPQYNSGYSFLGEYHIVVAFHSELPENGCALFVTGQGMKYISPQDIVDFTVFLDNNDILYKCTRLDIAFDDFEGIIPERKIVSSLTDWIHGENKNIVTKKSRNTCQIINGSYNGQFYTNFTLGSRGTDRYIRLYDKRAQMKAKDVQYWKRLEIELKRENAMNALSLIKNGENIAEVFADVLNNTIRFVSQKGSKFLYRRKSAFFWSKFLKVLSNMYVLKTIVDFKAESIKNTYSDTDLEPLKEEYSLNYEIYKMLYHLNYQYGRTISLLYNLHPQAFYRLIDENKPRIQENPKLEMIYNSMIKKAV